MPSHRHPSRLCRGHAEAEEVVRSFSLYPLFDKNVITEIETEDDAEVASYR